MRFFVLVSWVSRFVRCVLYAVGEDAEMRLRNVTVSQEDLLLLCVFYFHDHCSRS